jgi:hypothetical protein
MDVDAIGGPNRRGMLAIGATAASAEAMSHDVAAMGLIRYLFQRVTGSVLLHPS